MPPVVSPGSRHPPPPQKRMAARCGRETFPRMSLWTEYNYIYPGSPRPFKERGFGGDLSLAWTPVCTWSFDHWRWKCSRTCTPLGAQKVRCSQHGKYRSSFWGSRGSIMWSKLPDVFCQPCPHRTIWKLRVMEVQKTLENIWKNMFLSYWFKISFVTTKPFFTCHAVVSAKNWTP